jgi:hypothetical protein
MSIESKFLHRDGQWVIMECCNIPRGVFRSRSSFSVKKALDAGGTEGFDGKYRFLKAFPPSPRGNGLYAWVNLTELFKDTVVGADHGVGSSKGGMVAHNPKYDLKALNDVKRDEKIRMYAMYGGMSESKTIDMLNTIGDAVCPPKPVLFDGITAEECYRRYCVNTRQYENSPMNRWKLTPAQKTQAQLMWSAELRAKKVETETKERDRVRVDLEFEEWE